jgi:hypothetical protein
LTFELPAGKWRTAIDTFAAGPADLSDGAGSAMTIEDRWTVQGRSIVVLASR